MAAIRVVFQHHQSLNVVPCVTLFVPPESLRCLQSATVKWIMAYTDPPVSVNTPLLYSSQLFHSSLLPRQCPGMHCVRSEGDGGQPGTKGGNGGKLASDLPKISGEP